MGLFSKRKKSTDKSQKTDKNGSTVPTRSILTNSTNAKTVRFAASPVESDDDGESGFATDSELEVHRVRPQKGNSRVSGLLDSSIENHPALEKYRNGGIPHFKNTMSTSNSFTNTGDRSNRAELSTHDDSYMSDTGTQFQRGGRMRASLPIFRTNHQNNYLPSSSTPNALVFLSFHNETRKTVLPSEVKNFDTLKSMFLNAFPQLTITDLNSPRYRIYILDRTSRKFFILIHLFDIQDGSMLKLVDNENVTPKIVRRSRSHNSGLLSDTSYLSESELDYDSSTSFSRGGSFRVQKPVTHIPLTKETDVDGPIMNGYNNTPLAHHKNYSTLSLTHAANTGARQSPLSNNSFTTLPTHSSQYSYPKANYIPPQAHQSSVHNTKDIRRNGETPLLSTPQSTVLNISDIGTDIDAEISGVNQAIGSLTHDPMSRSRMAKMEAQIANLTAIVQNALSRPNSVASESMTEASHSITSSRTNSNFDQLRNLLGLSSCSTSTPQPDCSEAIKAQIRQASSSLIALKTELKQIRRIHDAQSEAISDIVSEATKKITGVLNKIPSVQSSAVLTSRVEVEDRLQEYKNNQRTSQSDLSDLEACVSELRSDVVSKRCHVNISEVEALALILSKSAQSASSLKSTLPKLSTDLKLMIMNESDHLLKHNEFLSKEHDVVESMLKRCKSVTNVLYTLKRLAVIENHRSILIPNLKWQPVDKLDKKALFQSIDSLEPDHSTRIKAIQKAEESAARKKEIMNSRETLKFEKSLELANKSLTDAENTSKPEQDPEVSKRTAHLKQVTDDMCSPPKNKVTTRNSRSTVLSTSIVQNRDSIHWGDDSDSSEDDHHQPNGSSFMTVNNTSAFTTVSQRKSGSIDRSVGLQPGPILTPPHNAQALQEQYIKLQQLQRSHSQNSNKSETPRSSKKPAVARKPVGYKPSPRSKHDMSSRVISPASSTASSGFSFLENGTHSEKLTLSPKDNSTTV